MVSFNELKKSRQENFQKLVTKVNEMTQGQNFGEEDPRFWKPTVDKEGNGFAIIRWLPAPPMDGENSNPFVMIWDHGFQGPGGWYIEKSLTSVGQPDPVAEYNSILWNRNQPGDRDFVSGIQRKGDTPGRPGSKRRLLYYSNILVVSDPAHPENNGKVFLYRYGKKIYDKIKAVMEHDKLDPDAKEFNPFDLWDGANFRLRITKDDDYRSYGESKFDAPSPACGGDEEQMKKVYESEYSLKELIEPKNFKSYAELKAKLNRVLGVSVVGEASAPEQHSVMSNDETEESASLPWHPSPSVDVGNDDDDEELKEFRRLVE